MEFTLNDWQHHDCVRGRPAIEEDVQTGRAVFYVPGSTDADVHPIDCPLPALLLQEDGSQLPVIVLQAQKRGNTLVFGLIDQHNNQFVATDSEVTVFESPPNEWRRGLEESR